MNNCTAGIYTTLFCSVHIGSQVVGRYFKPYGTVRLTLRCTPLRPQGRNQNSENYRGEAQPARRGCLWLYRVNLVRVNLVRVRVRLSVRRGPAWQRKLGSWQSRAGDKAPICAGITYGRHRSCGQEGRAHSSFRGLHHGAAKRGRRIIHSKSRCYTCYFSISAWHTELVCAAGAVAG